MQRTFSMQLGVALGAVLAASVAQAMSLSIDDIRSGDSFTSGNGKLEFSDFDFDSTGRVGEDDIVLEILDDGVRLSGPVSVGHDGKRSFEVSYTVTALDPTMPISGATLELESIVSGDPFAGVLATKKLLASGGDPDWSREKSWTSASRGSRSWKSSSWRSGKRDDDDDRWDDDDREHRDRRIGKGHDRGRGKGHEKARGKGHHRRHDDDDDDDDGDDDHGDREDALAILRAYDIQVGLGCYDDRDECSLDGQKLFDETGLDEPLGRLRVVDGVKIFSWGDGEAEWVSITNRFPVVPEPASAGLLGLGLLALAASRRYRARR